MKGRESGMPEENYWHALYDADCIVEKLECAKERKESIVEFGSGYGTFTIPAAERTSGIVHALDIEPDLIALVQRKTRHAGLANVRAEVRDFVAQGTGLPPESKDHAMVFNLLHIEDPVALLREAYRVLKPGGIVSIVHWKYDPSTPRGPSMSIRPRPEECRSWAEAVGFVFLRDQDLSECCQYHYGLLLMRPYAESKAAEPTHARANARIRHAPRAVSPFILKLRGVSCDFAQTRRSPFAFGKPITFMDGSASRVGLRGQYVRPADDAEGLSLWEHLLRRRERCRELLRTRGRRAWRG